MTTKPKAAKVPKEIVDLRTEVEGFITLFGLSKSRFGTLAIKDPHLVDHLREGKRRFTVETVSRIRTFMKRERDAALKAAAVPGARAATIQAAQAKPKPREIRKR
ncbi:MAG: hypothetical protein E7K72_24730 [Roseomonas mucosa]|nr:hypothetical protein [Roseomonas mucosa]